MKKAYIAIIGAVLPVCAMAQSAIDAQQVTQSDFKGTARFMSMGGAFTALGGDLSTLNQNPAGIGVYRSSELGVTMDINMQNTQTPVPNQYIKYNPGQTKVYCNNFGYVGATRLDGSLRTFNWGVTFNRAVSFDRLYQGYVPQTTTSLSNYIADFSYGIKADDMWSNDWDKYDPYYDSNNDWLSILAYNSFLINPNGVVDGGTGNSYTGLWKNNTVGDAMYMIREQGYVDEYNISFGGNFEDVVYWGLSVGITDLNYKRIAYYSESLANAEVPADQNANALTNGSFAYDLNNFKNTYGAGWNLKAGVIIRPINELRIGLAVHTPTFYKLTEKYDATLGYTYTPTSTNGDPLGQTVSNMENPEYTNQAYFQWKLNAPWKLMVGVAGVVNNRMIISADYEFAGYNSMNIQTPYRYDDFGGGYDFVADDNVNNDISTYFKAQNTLRFGLEYRVTPQFSVRGGYQVKMSNVNKDTYDGYTEVMTSGTDPSYSLDNVTEYITCGLGYRYQAWYIDAAYVYKNRESTYHAFTNWGNNIAPSAKVTDHNSSIVISTGFKF